MSYGFGEELTKDNIFKKISSYDIFKFYSENFKEVGKSFKSDIRLKDTNPSACVSMIDGDLLYTDFGLGKSFRCINYVMEKYGLTFVEALQRISDDFNLKLGVYGISPINTTPIVHNITTKFKEKEPATIKKKQRPFTKRDLEYWNSFYWTEEMLVKSNTQSISHYWINDNMWKVGENELAFSYEYYYHGGRMQRKLYFPERKLYKWFSNVDNTIVQLVNVMPKEGDILFITSSKKDAGVFWRLQLENLFQGITIHGVAPNNEGSFVPEEWFKKMQTRWSRIIIWYNNDWTKENNPGVSNAKKYAEKYDIEYYFNPDETEKDPSDFVRKYGLLEFRNLLMGKVPLIFS